MNDFVRKYADLNMMLKALYEVSFDAWVRSDRGRISCGTPAWAVADYKTIGLIVGRQCGATRSIQNWIKDRPGQCVYITKDSKIQKFFAENYVARARGRLTDYVGLAKCLGDSLERWDQSLSEEQLKSTRFVIVDDAQFTLNSHDLSRAKFNEWVAKTFHEDTFVILIK